MLKNTLQDITLLRAEPQLWKLVMVRMVERQGVEQCVREDAIETQDIREFGLGRAVC